MLNVLIKYNPYKVETIIEGDDISMEDSRINYVRNKRLQEWIEPRGEVWGGIFPELRQLGDSRLHIDFIGSHMDFEDLCYAKEQFAGEEFDVVELVHKNKNAEAIDPKDKMKALDTLYNDFKACPIDFDEYNKTYETKDSRIDLSRINELYRSAVSSNFIIDIVATMSSGKSTLINALMCRDLLPAKNTATTAVITTIKDNDALDDFRLIVVDKNGATVANETATKERIKEFNGKKDPEDTNGERSLMKSIQLEGPIPNLPSDVLNTVFVDTPGGNNSMNKEHEELMRQIIYDENKSLILYVFDYNALSTKDAEKILNMAADAMKRAGGGKQSRDRFLFIANKVDNFNPEEDNLEETVAQIKEMLRKKEIFEPHLFLTSALTAKLVRMADRNGKLSAFNETLLGNMLGSLGNGSNMPLYKYSSINQRDKGRFAAEVRECEEKLETTADDNEKERLRCRIAEINSGVPALELGIREYLEKYAVAIKIKSIHDTFLSVTGEIKIRYDFEKYVSVSEDARQAALKECEKNEEMLSDKNKFKAFSDKIDEIALDAEKSAEIRTAKAKIRELVIAVEKRYTSLDAEMKPEKARETLDLFYSELEKAGEKTKDILESALNDDALKKCQDIIDEYKAFIEKQDSLGSYKIGKYDMTKTRGFAGYRSDIAYDLLQGEFNVTKREVVGSHNVENKGIRAGLARIFGKSRLFGRDAYRKEDIYGDVEYVQVKKLIEKYVNRATRELNDYIENAVLATNDEIDKIKKHTKEKLIALNSEVTRQVEKVRELIARSDELEKKVAKDRANKLWIDRFTVKADNLLAIDESEIKKLPDEPPEEPPIERKS